MIDGLQPYPMMKNSSVEWLGDVPAHWDVRRLKSLLAQPVTDGPHITPQFLANGVPFLSVDGIQEGELVFRNCRYISTEDHAEFSNKVAPQRDDILLGKAASTGKIARVKVDFPFSIWSPLALIRIGIKETKPAFLEYVLKDVAAQAQIETFCTLNTQKNISMDDIPKLKLPLPPFPEQTTIVRFLDHANRRIRRYIRAKQKLITLLEEQKQAITHQAVTGQIDVRTGEPYSAYKPSGVEWLRNIPTHWEMRRSKRVFRPRKELARPNDIQLSATQAYGVIAQEQYEERVGRKVVKILQNLELRRHVEVNDFVISMRSFQGGLERAWASGCIRSSYIVLQPATKLAVGYFGYLFKSVGYINALQSTANFIRDGQDLNFANFCLVDLPFPPIEEQQRVQQALDRVSFDTGSAIERSRRRIDLLDEYRTRLIADVVTGKLDVCEAAAALPEVDSLAAEDDLDGTFDTDAKPDLDEIDTTLEGAEV